MDKHGKKMELSIWKEGYIFQITRKYKSKFYERTMTQQMWNIQDNKECLS